MFTNYDISDTELGAKKMTCMLKSEYGIKIGGSVK